MVIEKSFTSDFISIKTFHIRIMRENQRKRKKRKVLRLCKISEKKKQQQQKTMDHVRDSDTSCNWFTQNDPQRGWKS